MEQAATSSNSSSFEDLTKDNEVENMQKDEGLMDILGNNQLTKKVSEGDYLHIIQLLDLSIDYS